MGRVDKFHKSKATDNKRANNSSMEEILGKKALKINKKKPDNGNSNIRKKKAKKKKGPLNRVLAALAILFVLLTGGYLAFQYVTTGSISNVPFATRSEEFDDGEVTLLILGTDGNTEADGDRSDTIIVCRLNLEEGYARMISIPRDTRVKIPGKNTNKINAAFSFGGVDLAKETVENFYNITIDRTMIINFETFTDSVDKLGGIEIIWEDENPLISDEYNLNIKQGVNKLDSVTALNFVRFRGTPTADLGRISRQQLFLKSLGSNIKNKANVIQQLDIINSIYRGIETDLSLSEMMYIFNSYKEFDNFNMTTWMSAGYPEYIDGISYVLPDKNIKKLAQGFLDGNLVVSNKDEGSIFPELITLEEKAIADQEEAKKVADENSK